MLTSTQCGEIISFFLGITKIRINKPRARRAQPAAPRQRWQGERSPRGRHKIAQLLAPPVKARMAPPTGIDQTPTNYHQSKKTLSDYY